MPAKSRRHPKYKAYVAQQLRILQVKFPFLGLKQIQAKIRSSWDAFTSERRDNWASVPSNKPDSSPIYVSDNTGHDHDIEISRQPQDEPYASKFSPSIEKKVRFSVPLEEHTHEICDLAADRIANEWPAVEDIDFNTIISHKLHIEQQSTAEESGDDDIDGGRKWSLFGDGKKTSPADSWENNSEERSITPPEKGDLMCDMFDPKSKHGTSNKSVLIMP